MKFKNNVFCLFISLPAFLFGQNKFITKWYFTSPGTSINFNALTVGVIGDSVSYSWYASPSGNNGKGKFRTTTAGSVSLTNLTILSGDVVTLSIDSAKLKRFFMYNLGPGVDRLKLIDVSQWGTVVWSSMESAFQRCDNLQISATDTPNLSAVSNCSDMFRSCTNLNSPANIGKWNTANVTNMSGVFAAAINFNQSVNGWNTSNVTDMSVMFGAAHAFNQPLDSWNTSNVIWAGDMFYDARSFNQPLNSWNTSNITGMSSMFYSALVFNQPLNSWNVAKVGSMYAMFGNALAFNQPLNSWNTANVVEMDYMFWYAKAFNQPLNKWNVRSVKDFRYMFYNAKTFNKSLSAWGTKLQNFVSLSNFLDSCGMDVANYDSTLIGFWRFSPSGLINMNMGAAGLKYCKAKLQRDSLILASGSGGKGWTISGDIQDLYCGAFVTLWSNFTINTSQIDFNAQTSGGIVNYTWIASPSGNNGTGSFIMTNAGPVTLAGLNIPAGNILTIKMSPDNLKRFFINNGVNRQNLFEVKEWGSVKWSSMVKAFYGCNNLQITASDVPNLSAVSNCSDMFRQCANLNSPNNIGTWNTANVTNMSGMFASAITFNQTINTWNTAKVTDMNAIFSNARAFNQPLDSWNTTSLTRVSQMFYDARAFNQPLNSWNTSNVTSMSYMFYGARAFNQSLNSWNTSKVTSMYAMFLNAFKFNQSLNSWNIANVVNMDSMFRNAKNFNKSIATWASSFNNNVNLFGFLDSCGMDIAAYDSTLIAFWKFAPNGLSLGAAGLKYCEAKLQRDSIIVALGSGGKGWTISGDIQDLYCGAFITLWSNFTINTSQIHFNAQTSGGIVNYTWIASPSGNNGTGSFTMANAGVVTLTGLNIPAGDILTIKMSPDNLKRFFINNGINRQNLFEVNKWGSVKWNSMESAFYGCDNLQISATDTPNLSGVSNCADMFRQCTNLNSPANIGKWNTANVTNMSGMFASAMAFNQSINAWNTAKATDMSAMFGSARAFNKPLDLWNTTNLIKASQMFYDARAFDQPLNLWNTSNITSMSYMFYGAVVFNQSLNSWNTTKVTGMSSMFGNAFAFNQSLNSWNTANVLNMDSMFRNATSFNKSIAKWASNFNNNVKLSGFLDSCGMDIATYDSALIAFWKSSPNGLSMGAAGLKYCKAKLQRDSLILASGSGGKGWTTNIGDALISTYAALSDKGKSVIVSNECSFNYFNPLNNSQHLIHLNPNGNNNFIPVNITINHNSIDTLPGMVTSQNGYYQVSKVDSTIRLSNRLISIMASGSFNSNGGVIVRIYYDPAEHAAIINDKTPSGAVISESGWFKSSFQTAKELLENIKTGKNLFLSAIKISPTVTATENGVSYAEFLLTDFSTIGFFAKNDKLSDVKDINLAKTKVLIYPNPNEGILTISNLSSEQINTIQIKDALGRIVFTTKPKENTNEIQITMPKEKGIYFIEIQSNDNLIIEKILRI